MTSREAIRGNEVAIEECDFAAGPDWLRPFRDVPWLVETSGSVPSVRLNTGIDGLAQVLRGHGTGPERVARELLTAQIVAEVWTASFHAAVGELDTDESGRPRWPEGWWGTVLRAMLADVLPDATPDDALAEVHSIRTGRTGWSELQPRIIYAAQRRAKVARSLGHAVRALDLANRSEP
ncbi:conserved hypothetical protein [Streptomyces sp. SPB78]|uniref:hypothetical protein n=1 Tax=Streptomyces sp. (strain SPB78) TaxID=591157 RepID=UPI0001B57416|nr:hypothetical protein [Streptomyces sp. SPB78]EFL02298.1 conserved hypothetical protein [Streptomyces sp. SPB78]